MAQLAPEIEPTRDLRANLFSWVLGCAMVYLALFGSGKLILGNFWSGALLLFFGAICAGALYRNILDSWEPEKHQA